MNPEYMSEWIRACFERANNAKHGPLLFSLYEFPLEIPPHEMKIFSDFMTERINDAARDALIEYFDGHEEINPELIVDAMKWQCNYHWDLKFETEMPKYPNGVTEKD